MEIVHSIIQMSCGTHVENLVKEIYENDPMS
jgi:hypothetical protein